MYLYVYILTLICYYIDTNIISFLSLFDTFARFRTSLGADNYYSAA